MPYIKMESREKFNDVCREISNKIEDPGELNYVFTILCHLYLKKKGKCYKNINEIMGVFSCCSREFYRKIASPYEDLKVIENGDVEI